jgi:alpha-1,2-mannosyltransferase
MGGAERYLLKLVKALQSRGYTVSLYTVDRTDWDKVSEVQGINTRPDIEYYTQKKELELGNIFTWIKAGIIYLWLLIRAREETDLSINNYGEILPIISDISIIHAVPLVEKNGNTYNIPLWELIQPIFGFIHGTLAKKTSKLIITNSKYNKELIQKHYKAEIVVINPPIETPRYYGEQKNGRILSVARISPNKNLQAITEIANRSYRNRFIVAGKTDQNSEKVLRVLREMRNIDVYINPQRESLLELMKRSSVLLSTQQDEAFGMVVVESMGVGCIPVVYRGGGPWTDIMDENEEVIGFSYGSTLEAQERIEQILGDGELRSQMRENCVKRSMEFNTEIFEEKITTTIEGYQPLCQEDNYAKIYRLIKKVENIRVPVLRG